MISPLPSLRIPLESARRSLAAGPVARSAPKMLSSFGRNILGAAPPRATRLLLGRKQLDLWWVSKDDRLTLGSNCSWGVWGIWTEPRNIRAVQWNSRRGPSQNQQLKTLFWGGPFRAVPQSPLYRSDISRLREAAPAVLLLLQPKRRWFGSLTFQRTEVL